MLIETEDFTLENAVVRQILKYSSARLYGLGVALMAFVAISATAHAETQFEMCRPPSANISSPFISETSSIEIAVDTDFKGMVSVYSTDSVGREKFRRFLTAGKSFKTQTHVGQQWVVKRANGDCAYVTAAYNTKEVIKDGNAANSDGSRTFVGTWEWSNKLQNHFAANNSSTLTIYNNGRVNYCYNDKCYNSNITDHGSYMSFTLLGITYYEFSLDAQARKIYGSVWRKGSNRNNPPDARTTMSPGHGP